MGEELSDTTREQVYTELRAGRKISAVKLYREATGVGLKEAKDAVEAIQVELEATAPAGSQAPGRAKGGCLPMVVLFAGVASGGACWWG